MFKSLKEKLSSFKKKAKEDIEKKGGGEGDKGRDREGITSPYSDRRVKRKGKKESKFFKKVFARKERKKEREDQGPKVNREGEKGITLDSAVTESGLKGDDILKVQGSLVDEQGGIFSKKITEKDLDNSLFDLELALLESDVAQPVVERIKSFMIDELTGIKVGRKTDIDELIEQALRRSIKRVLNIERIDFDEFIENHEKPVVVMFVGVNGTGKTTVIGKIGHRLKKEGVSCVLVAGDTFRAGAIEQLSKHGDNLGLKVIKHKANSDPAAVAYDALEHARARKKDVILLDTAGRMQTNINLMDEMKKIKRVAKPDMIVFVGDSLAGNDAVIQAQKFDETVGIDGVILTKIDTDAKGGAALSIAYTIGKPILFVGTGQEYGDLIPFDSNWMTERLFEG